MDRDTRIAIEILGGIGIVVMAFVLRRLYLPEPVPAPGGDPDGGLVELMGVMFKLIVVLPIYIVVCVFVEKAIATAKDS
ncbi:hypothetical protein [Nocardioides cavernaquae]|uniref:Uncharacterized protein n=1 Tax=Nocardioides cavernaquae TaxID=2321396 RepID=A0A3A5HAK7_9ACTN|nr:hypothetical protein [Nocardioides cavernaquae]RJS46888.1 hypothetical protein D4739_12125 [Nocardioides cavernaquae]